MNRDELLADVATGRLDAALLLDTGDVLGDLGFSAPAEFLGSLAFLDVEEVPLVVVVAPGHRLAGRLGLDNTDLVGERLLVNGPGCSFFMAADRILGPGLDRVRVGSVSVMRACAERGLGLALLPEFAVSDAVRSGTLARIALPAPGLSLRLIWRGDREDVPGLRDVLYAAAA